MATPKNNLGAFVRDANNNPVSTGNGILTLDSLRSSPFTIPSASIFDLVIPPTAVEVTLYCDQDLRLSEDSLMGTYFVLPADTSVTLSHARDSQLFFKLDSAPAATLNFFYTKI